MLGVLDRSAERSQHGDEDLGLGVDAARIEVAIVRLDAVAPCELSESRRYHERYGRGRRIESCSPSVRKDS